MKNSRTDSQILAAQLLTQLLAEDHLPQPNISDTSQALSSVLSKLDDLNTRLIEIESKLSQNEVKIPTNLNKSISPVFPVFMHPSTERFAVEDAVDLQTNNKACHFEPGGKPCDNCGMCSSRGF